MNSRKTVPDSRERLMDSTDARRADIDAKQTALAATQLTMAVEAIVLLMPAHVAWFTAGLNVRGLFADSERPGVYTNGRQRWLLCSNADTQRLFDEELDQLGFQLREWHWEAGRSDMLATITAGKKVAADRPYPNIPMVNDHLRPLLRVLSAFEREQYQQLGKSVAHAVEATARTCSAGQTEEEIAGQLGHRLIHHGLEPAAISVTADDYGAKYRRTGFGPTPATRTAVLQATGQRGGLYATCSRTVSFGPVPDEFRVAHDLAMKQAALFRSLTQPGAGVGATGRIGRQLLANTPFEFDWRLAPPGYGAGRFPAEELRRAGAEEPLAAGQAVVWQPRVGPAAVVDTLIVADGEPVAVTPPEEWPLKRFTLRGSPPVDVPDIYVRSE
jgi:Xaa-Pro dipeptidase